MRVPGPALAALAGLAILACASEPVFREARPAPGMPERGVSAHRGGGEPHPDNTLRAVESSLELGVHQIEVDVRMSAPDPGSGERELVLFHDEKVQLPDGSRWRVSEVSPDALRMVELGGGARIPTLRELLDAVPRNVWLNLDLKSDRNVSDAALAAAVTREVCLADRLHQSVLGVRGEGAAAAHAVHPEVFTNPMDRRLLRRHYIDDTIEGGDEFIQLHWLRGRPDGDEVERLHAAGVRIHYCCDDDPDVLRDLFEVGVDFPMTDDPVAAMAVAEERGIPPVQPDPGPGPACALP